MSFGARPPSVRDIPGVSCHSYALARSWVPLQDEHVYDAVAQRPFPGYLRSATTAGKLSRGFHQSEEAARCSRFAQGISSVGYTLNSGPLLAYGLRPYSYSVQAPRICLEIHSSGARASRLLRSFGLRPGDTEWWPKVPDRNGVRGTRIWWR